MSLIGLFQGTGPTGFGYNSAAEEVTDGVDLSGKTYLLTGCSSGLGEETLRVLSMRGAHLIAAARSVESAREAIARAGADATAVACDLSDPASVRGAIVAIKSMGRPLDAIICNAGIMALPTAKRIHGIEEQFFTNHIGHFILVTGLLDSLADDGRVVMVSSSAHKMAPAEGIGFDDLAAEKSYSPWGHYGQSKLANLLFARELGRRLDGTGKTANALHPGVIRTNLGRHMNILARGGMALGGPMFMKNIPQGAATSCYLAAHPAASGYNGEYFADCNPAKSSAYGRDMELAARLWEKSEEIVAEVLPT